MNSAKNDNLEPGLGTRRFSKFQEDFRVQSGSQTLKTAHNEFCTPSEKVIIVPDTNYIIYAIKKLILYIPSPGKLPKYRPFNMNTTGLRACETMCNKLGKNKRSSIKNQLAPSSRSSSNADQKW